MTETNISNTAEKVVTIHEWVEQAVEISKEPETDISEIEANEDVQTDTRKELSVLDAASESKYERIDDLHRYF